MADTLTHLFLVVMLPPLLLGVIVKTKAVFAGRIGPPLFQPYYDLSKLLQKGTVFSGATTWIFRAGPVVALAATLLAALLMPLGSHRAAVSFTGDVILFAYLLALGRFFTASAALDTGSSFEGMGAAREVTFACLAEPALFLGLLVLARLSRWEPGSNPSSLSLTGMLQGPLTPEWKVGGAALVLVLISWFVVLLAENARIPFDDPNTHLELTMIHEVMVLDHSGPGLALVLYGAALKLFVFGALVVSVAVPFSTGNAWADWGLFLVAMLVLMVVVGVVESVMARLRLVHVPRLLVAACVLAAFGMILLVSRPL
ncbi:MAG TPA: NADH-quinone oxidoreductase subunit H [Gemmataceae bacterium]|nr:NADH-quinone oxidoreductase subunit H [Gemmataceae bacterium]